MAQPCISSTRRVICNDAFYSSFFILSKFMYRFIGTNFINSYRFVGHLYTKRKDLQKMNNSLPEIVTLTASKIDALRCEQRLTIRGLSQKAGITKSTMYNIIQAMPHQHFCCHMLSVIFYVQFRYLRQALIYRYAPIPFSVSHTDTYLSLGKSNSETDMHPKS